MTLEEETGIASFVVWPPLGRVVWQAQCIAVCGCIWLKRLLGNGEGCGRKKLLHK
jgi:hypothetical protein